MEKNKDRKTPKSRCEEKVVVFSSISLFLEWKEAISYSGTRGIKNPTRRIQGAGIVKGWEEKRDHGAHSRYIT